MKIIRSEDAKGVELLYDDLKHIGSVEKHSRRLI